MMRKMIIAGSVAILAALSFFASVSGSNPFGDVIVAPRHAPQSSAPSRPKVHLSRQSASEAGFVVLSDIVPDIIQEIRYFSTYNFVGRRLPGYVQPVALMTRQAADSLRAVSDELVAKGYRLKVFDAYRPKRAVQYFVNWARDPSDTLMKRYFYPKVNKADVFRLGYVSSRSGHSRGSTIDLTLFDMKTEREVDMGGTYDFFGEVSHPKYTLGLTEQQLAHRRLLRETMMRHGFKPVSTEWWHFSLRNEPYPDTEFDFDVSMELQKHE